jgi:pimeloyl-ACP methyl ester carboxylesterase
MLIMANPTIVLVHGAFADASSWSRLYAELAGDGLAVKAPPNPLRGVTAGDAEYLKCFIGQIEGPVLLIGHSYGGAVITAAGVADNVVGLVYAAGFAPDEGEDLGTLQSNFPAPVAGPYIRPAPLPDGGTEFTITAAPSSPTPPPATRTSRRWCTWTPSRPPRGRPSGNWSPPSPAAAPAGRT